ncbi:SMP-30/gluconolactonase/LRE family protein [Pseudonocardia sp. RS010]|uniref:SMP-30/gluconolactonase/LRE family protein n=1 Tax=Pseudonocardia sp. RS010 TaxID=3385979 RepID=UPI0039A0B9A6
MDLSTRRVLFDGLWFGEGPRWDGTRLWVSDQHANTLYWVEEGRTSVRAKFDDMPSGIGFLPDGTALVAAMRSCRLLAVQGESDPPELFVDMSKWGPQINDMLTDSRGNTYVGVRSGGYAQPPQGSDTIVLVTPEGEMRLVEEDLRAPNGMVVTPDGGTLIVASTMGRQIVAYDIADNGDLENRRLWASLTDGAIPDGMCLDAEGMAWVGNPGENPRFLRIAEGGEIVDEIPVGPGDMAIACVFGGPDRSTLYLIVNNENGDDIHRFPNPGDEHDSRFRGRVEAVECSVPGAGIP